MPRAIAKAADSSERRSLASMAMGVVAAEALLRPERREEYRPGGPEYVAKDCYRDAAEVARIASRCVKRIGTVIAEDGSMGEREIAQLLLLALLIDEAKVLSRPMAKTFYAKAYEEPEMGGLPDVDKWKGRYSVLLVDARGETVCSASGARELASLLRISQKNATDKLSRAFPGHAGPGRCRIVVRGRKCDVIFYEDDE